MYIKYMYGRISTSQNIIIKKNSTFGYYNNMNVNKLDQIECHLEFNDEQIKLRIMS